MYLPRGAEAARDAEHVTGYKLEACMCVALGALGAMIGVVPGLPRDAYVAALMIVPPGLFGGLMGVVAIAGMRRKQSEPPRLAGDGAT